MLVKTATEAPRVSKAKKLIVSVLLALFSPAWVFHELGHALAWWRAGHPIREVAIGIGKELESSTVTIGIGRFRVSFVLSWRERLIRALAVGVGVGDEVRATAGFAQRLCVHLAGPLANLIVAVVVEVWLLFHGGVSILSWVRMGIVSLNLWFMLLNLVPMPGSDGGWIVTLVYARMFGRDYAWEVAWHEGHKVWHCFVHLVVVLLGVLDVINALWSWRMFHSAMLRILTLLGVL